MHGLALLNLTSPLHPAAGGDPVGLFIPSIAGLIAFLYGLWMVIHPNKFLQWFERRLYTLGDNPYRYDPVRLQNKRNALMSYINAKDPLKKIRSKGIYFIVGAVLFELVIWLSYLFL